MFLLKQNTRTWLLIPDEQFYMQAYSYHKELILEQNKDEHKPKYQLIFDTPIMSPSAMYIDQYSDTHQLPRPQYWTHSSTYKIAYTLGTYNNILVSHYITFWNNVLFFLKKTFKKLLM